MKHLRHCMFRSCAVGVSAGTNIKGTAKMPLVCTVVIAFAILSLTAVSLARDYGQYRHVPRKIKTWIENLTDHRGIPCCATADGAVPDVWEMGASHYRVKIHGEWLDVPDAAVIKAPNRLGHAVVWIDTSEDIMGVRCFLPGPQT